MRRVIFSFIAMGVLIAVNQAWIDKAKAASAEEEPAASASEEEISGIKYDLGNVIVSATKTETYQAEIGSSTTVITSEDIKKSGKRDVEAVLRDVPGLTVIQTGAQGGLTSVYMRGAGAGQTLVMIDGVEVNDPIEASRTFDFAHLLTDNIERIEIVRGPQSTLYGSDAMAGIINIVTKKGTGKPQVEGSFEGGSHGTFTEYFGLRGTALDKLDYSFSATCLNSSGISVAEGGSENDPYYNLSLSSKLGYKIFDNAQASLVVNYIDARKSIDAYNNFSPYQLIDMPNYTSWSKDLSTKFAFDQSINSWWAHTLSFSYHDIRRKDKKEWDPANLDTINDWYKGNNKKVEWQHNISPVKWNIFTAGFEYENESGSSYFYADPDYNYMNGKQDRKSVYNYGYYFQDQLKIWDRLFITPGLRVDDHEMFGTKTTYKISTAYLIPETGTRLKGNWGTGFKAPTLYQLYSVYGNLNLKPEENNSYDVGFEQSFFKDKLFFDLTYFHNDFKNMINFVSLSVSPYGEYMNVAKAMTQGFEIGAKIKPFDNLTFGTNYTYTDTEDKSTGLELARRPKNQVNFDIDWGFLPGGNLNFGMNYVGKRWDNTSNTVNDKAYTVFRMAAFYDITKNFRIFGRIENLFDKKYQEVYAYETLGRSFYAGIKGSF
ncbi:MAG: TonB-dependent receptor [Candidatus Omnitrophota bacterium]|jgi:vitamin B12 transporter